MVNRESILSFFREKTRKPLAFREIVSVLRLSHKEMRSLKRVLREMVKAGDIVLTRNGLYGPSEEMSLVTGCFESHRDGYGFVIVEKPGERDIFVPARSTLGALDNDRVMVRVENWHRREGRIIRVLDRATSRVVGILETTREATYVRPKNKAIPFDLYIAPPDRGKARHGDAVVVEILTYGREKRPPTGKVVKVIEKPEDPKAEVEAIIEEFNLPRRFPKAAHEAAQSLTLQTLHEAVLKRRDLRDLRTVTIDGERAKDFDDAVSVKLTEHGYRLWVHIADVSAYVEWDSEIDREARKRGTSVYLSDRVIPMLPKELSEDLCSLIPNVERYAFTVEMDFDRDGNRRNATFYPSLIQSDERMTYTSVRKILVDNDTHERKRYDYLLGDFELMNELFGILRKRRMDRGSLDFDLPEPEVLLDLQGSPEAIIRAERNLAHMLIEDFMIAANEAVAEHLESLGVPSLYRIHEEPDPLKLEDIARVIRPIVRLRKNTMDSRDFSYVLRAIRGKPSEEIVNYMVLRSLKQARYSSTNVGHFGLASRCYSHFTSPIRRYPDLVVHRILKEVLTKRQLPQQRVEELKTMLPEIAFHSSRMERLANEAEREVINAMRVWFMKGREGEEYSGSIVSITPYGLKVRLKDVYVEGFIHVSYLTDDFYQFNEKTLSLTGRHTKRSFSIGTDVTVRVDRVDMEERELILGLCQARKGS